MSTDVPQLKQKPKKRHQLVRLATRWIKYDQRNTFLLLYTITFVRSRDYLGLFLRLSILGIFLIYWIPLFWGKIVFGLLILFLSGFQFVSIYNHHQSLDWIRLYPLSSELRKKSVHQLILLLMGIQILILFPFFIWLDELGNALIFLAIAIVFTVLFESFYLKGRIKKIEAN